MSVKKVHDIQPENFEFTKENLELANNILKKYPAEKKKSSVMPLLYLAQIQNNNWIPLSALKYIGKFLSMPYINVYEIATFYTMYNLAPVGKYFVQVCTTTPCLLRGANEIVKVCKDKISKNEGAVSKNGMCSWIETECLGACVNAPILQVNDDFYEDLNYNSTKKLIEGLKKDKKPNYGSIKDRKSEPENGATVLLSIKGKVNASR